MANNQGRASYYNNIYYIHFRYKNIGQIEDESDSSSSLDLTELLKKSRQQLKNEYKSKLQASMISTPTANSNMLQTLKDITNLDEEELIKQINKDLTQSLQQVTNTKILAKIHEKMQDESLSQKNLAKVVKNDVTALNDVLKTLDEMLKYINNPLFNLSLQQLTQNATNIEMVGQQLSTKLEAWRKNNDLSVFTKQQRQQADKIILMLDNLAHALMNKTFKSSGSSLSAAGLSRLLLGNFSSTTLAENFAIISKRKAETVSNTTIKNIIPKSVGSSQGVTFTEDGVKNSITNKTDILLPKVKVGFQTTGSDAPNVNTEFKINIGISSKFYKNNSFLGNSSKKISGTIGSGSGGKLSSAIDALNLTQRQKYLMYNYFAHGMEKGDLNAIILTRQLIRLFGSANMNEFSQFLLVNGRIVPLWSIVDYVCQNTLSGSASEKNAQNQGLVLHIEGREKIYEKMSKDKAEESENILVKQNENGKILALGWHRSHLKNDDINNATISAELRLFKMAQFFKKNYNYVYVGQQG